MPELPEVETITNDLKKRLIGWTIKGVWSDWPRYFTKSGGWPKVKRILVGRKILNINRLGKNIIFNLSEDYIMAVHLKMTGHFLLAEPKKTNFIHFFIKLGKGGKKSQLYFSDVRKFGRIIVGQSGEVMARPEIKKLGPDPLVITSQEFLDGIVGRRGRIKSVLLNQEFLAGVGNIYSDEALYLAKIHPLSRAEKIPSQKLKLLFNKLVGVLEKSIKLRGTTRQDYRDPAGKKGDYFNQRLVYAKKGSKCPYGGTVETIKVGSRTSHFCPKCQILY
ncbi:MAG: DNA-formamidopyrimidine glycosylase [Parcubacteria group bacterium]|nr:DNA-formamidopyrimidine glycosylase [Parcubacteria group bacterium]